MDEAEGDLDDQLPDRGRRLHDLDRMVAEREVMEFTTVIELLSTLSRLAGVALIAVAFKIAYDRLHSAE